MNKIKNKQNSVENMISNDIIIITKLDKMSSVNYIKTFKINGYTIIYNIKDVSSKIIKDRKVYEAHELGIDTLNKIMDIVCYENFKEYFDEILGL